MAWVFRGAMLVLEVVWKCVVGKYVLVTVRGLFWGKVKRDPWWLKGERIDPHEDKCMG